MTQTENGGFSKRETDLLGALPLWAGKYSNRFQVLNYWPTEQELITACKKARLQDIEAIVEPYSNKESCPAAIWPSIPVALYYFRRNNQHVRDFQIPSEVKKLVEKIGSHAEQLKAELSTLRHEFSRPGAVGARRREIIEAWQYLSWFVDSQETFDAIMKHFDMPGDVWYNPEFEKEFMNFEEMLSKLSNASEFLLSRFPRDALIRQRTLEYPGLPHLIADMLRVWPSFNSKRPGFGKVISKDRSDDGGPFIRFVQSVMHSIDPKRVPTAEQIRIAHQRS